MGTGLEVTEDEGMVSRAIEELFEIISQIKEAKVSATYMELYNEEIIDLLSINQRKVKRKKLAIREDEMGRIYVGVKEIECKNAQDLLQVLSKGTLCRSTGMTDMNMSSSRSHAIFTVYLRIQKSEEELFLSKFHFVDLAGSERMKKTNAQGLRARESISINTGLLSLGNVISALSDDGIHVPYRDSKLTRLLQDSLGGNSQTFMLACVSPADSNYQESLNTLMYANRAKKIKNQVVLNKEQTQMCLLKKVHLLQQNEKYHLSRISELQQLLHFEQQKTQMYQLEPNEIISQNFELRNRIREMELKYSQTDDFESVKNVYEDKLNQFQQNLAKAKLERDEAVARIQNPVPQRLRVKHEQRIKELLSEISILRKKNQNLETRQFKEQEQKSKTKIQQLQIIIQSLRRKITEQEYNMQRFVRNHKLHPFVFKKKAPCKEKLYRAIQEVVDYHSRIQQVQELAIERKKLMENNDANVEFISQELSNLESKLDEPMPENSYEQICLLIGTLPHQEALSLCQILVDDLIRIKQDLCVKYARVKRPFEPSYMRNTISSQAKINKLC